MYQSQGVGHPCALNEPCTPPSLPSRSDCAYYFSLSWLITWYGHVVQSQEQASRLMDLFLSSHPLMPIYLAAAVSQQN